MTGIKRNTKINQGTCDALKVLVGNGGMSGQKAAKALGIGGSTAARMMQADYNFDKYKEMTVEAMRVWKAKKNGVSGNAAEEKPVVHNEVVLATKINELLVLMTELNDRLKVMESEKTPRRGWF